MKQDELEIPGLAPAAAAPARLKPLGQIKRRLIQGSGELQECETDSIVYQHSVLCQTVMPYRNPRGVHTVMEPEARRRMSRNRGRSGV